MEIGCKRLLGVVHVFGEVLRENEDVGAHDSAADEAGARARVEREAQGLKDGEDCLCVWEVTSEVNVVVGARDGNFEDDSFSRECLPSVIREEEGNTWSTEERGVRGRWQCVLQ